MTSNPFANLMHALLRHSGIAIPAGDAHEVYSLHFDGEPDVHLIGRAPCRTLEIACEAGSLAMPADSGKLMTLLEMNRCDGMQYPVSIAADRSSGAVLVWTLREFAGLDVAAALQLVQDVRQKSAMVRRVLAVNDVPPLAVERLASRVSTLSGVLALRHRRGSR